MWAVTATSTATCRHVRLGQTCPFVNFDLSYLDEFCEFFYATSFDVDQNVEIANVFDFKLTTCQQSARGGPRGNFENYALFR